MAEEGEAGENQRQKTPYKGCFLKIEKQLLLLGLLLRQDVNEST